MPDIFPEIVDIIIDHLHDDKKSLFACSTVCRGWLPGSRFHLFHTVTLYDILNGSPLEDFASFLRVYIQIGPCIRELDIVGTPGSTRSIPLPVLGSLTAQLPSIHTLKLYNIMWSEPHEKSIDLFPSQTLKALHISNTELGDSGIRAIFDIIELSPILERFSMDYVYLHRGQDSHPRIALPDLPNASLPDRKLRKVSMHASQLTRQFLAYIQITSSSKTLDSLSVSSPLPDVESLGDFLHDIGPRLRHLHLRFTFPPPCVQLSNGFWDELGVSECLGLESIRIFVPMRPCSQRAHGYTCYWQHVLNLIKKLPGRIRKVEVGLHVEARKEDVYLKRLATAPWGELEQAFSLLEHLDEVRFEDEELFFQDKCKPLTDGARKYIQRRLRGLRKKGVLHFG